MEDEESVLQKRRRLARECDQEQGMREVLKGSVWRDLAFDSLLIHKYVETGPLQHARMPVVESKWDPESAHHLPAFTETEVYFPDAEEFEDPIRFIQSIRHNAEKTGMCRIIPPRSWKLPSALNDETMKVCTRVQGVHKLHKREPGEPSGFDTGPDMKLVEFRTYAENFKRSYFARKLANLQDIEGEYWRIVENSSDRVEVLFGMDSDSGCPKPERHDTALKSDWNVNSIARHPGSVLSFLESDISGVTIPRLFFGSCFSSFCWRVEEHNFYSLKYLHYGDPIIWYAVSRESANKLEEIMKKHMPGLFNEQPDLLLKLVTQLSPVLLQEEGIAVYKVMQRPGDFVVTFPRAYHCGFSTGFCCLESANFAPVDWLSHGYCAIERYQTFRRKPLISYDELLFAAVHCLLDAMEQPGRVHPYWLQTYNDPHQFEMVMKAFKARVHSEHSRRHWLGVVTERKACTNQERRCFYCNYDLYLSATSCDCSPNRYACLEHVDMLCRCRKDKKTALYRLTTTELFGYITTLEKAFKELDKETTSSAASKSDSEDEEPATVSVGSAFRQTPVVLNRSNDSARKQKPTPPKEVVVLSDDEEVQVAEIAEQKSEPMTEPDFEVELLDVGTLPQGGWCNKLSIFPAGFKSRIKYHNFLDLSRVSYYVCEIVDCGVDEPYFKVTLEGYPTQCFVDISADLCWRSIQRRLNYEIQARRKLGMFNVPPVQNPEAMDGLKMFGLKTPAIKKVVEALDYKRVCSTYWTPKKPGKLQTDLTTLFKKGTKRELWALHEVFSSEWREDKWKRGFKALVDVLQTVIEGSPVHRYHVAEGIVELHAPMHESVNRYFAKSINSSRAWE